MYKILMFAQNCPCPGLVETSKISRRRCHTLANIKSAKKRVLVAQTRAERNKAIRSKVKTFVKKVLAAVEAGDKAGLRRCLHPGRL